MFGFRYLLSGGRNYMRLNRERVTEQERTLRCLAMNDQAALESLLGMSIEDRGASGLDAKTQALVRLGALVALGAAPPTYQWAAQVALSAGASDEDIIGILVALAPIVSLTRVVSAAPEIAIALGYPIDEAFEVLEELPESLGKG